ncbi:MAG: hypothetical protein DI609_05490 [Corynebacterium urealyticum]|uniref:Uncharacterized protein n=1 Tax=Corynebacterium urealyticum TaxID=43771 RepID=A0A2W5B220_9CORY|nr:MAG: hypothetical protein DI609_05490 [Corynebacterium urealyticum]
MNAWGSKLLRSDRARHSGALRDMLRTPVIVDVADHDSADAVAMAVAATGREQLRQDEAESKFPNGQHRRLRRVDDALLASLSEPVTAGGALELAEELGAIDTPRIHVHGVQGGAGTSSLAVHLALALAHCLFQDATPVSLVDADPDSVGLDLLCGWEGVPGRRVGERGIGGHEGEDIPAEDWPVAPGGAGLRFRSRRLDAVGGRPEPNADLVVDYPAPGIADYPRAGVVVVDRGRVGPMADVRGVAPAGQAEAHSAATDAPCPAARAADLVVCVTRPTVAGVHALGRCLAELDAADVPAVGVLREEAGLETPIALRQMLGGAPVELWPWDGTIAAEPLDGCAGEASVNDLQLGVRILGYLPGASEWGRARDVDC